MNIGSVSQVSTLVPDSAAGKPAFPAGETQAPGQSWATSTEVENWAGDKPPAEPASQRVDIRV